MGRFSVCAAVKAVFEYSTSGAGGAAAVTDIDARIRTATIGSALARNVTPPQGAQRTMAA